MPDLSQYLELLGRGAQAAQWGLYVGLVNLFLLVVNMVVLVISRAQPGPAREDTLRFKRTGLEKPPPPPPPTSR